MECFVFFSPCTSGSVIPEENVDESSSDQSIPNMNGMSSGSLSLPIQPQQHQQQQPYRTESPQSSYSPYGNSPVIDQPSSTGYMMMSPGTDFNKGYVNMIFLRTFIQFFVLYFHLFKGNSFIQ